MTRWSRTGLATLSVFAIIGVRAATQSGGPTFRGGVDMVTVGVFVREGGQPVLGLQPQDFELRDDGVLQNVSDVSFEKLPVDVTVALDVSESVTGALLDQMRTAVAQLAADLGRADRLKLLTFNMSVRRVMDFADDRARADAALARVTPTGSTALLDTIAVALTTPSPSERRALVIAFSDGLDTASVTDRPTLLDIARLSSATAAVVLPASGGLGPETPARKFYDQLAEETGGLVVSMHPRDDLGPTFRRVLSDFRSSYVLHFTPKGVQPGGLHKLDVRVRRRGVDVRSRGSYAWKTPN